MTDPIEHEASPDAATELADTNKLLWLVFGLFGSLLVVITALFVWKTWQCGAAEIAHRAAVSRLVETYQAEIKEAKAQGKAIGYRESFDDTINDRNRYSIQLNGATATVWERLEEIPTPPFAKQLEEMKKSDLAASVLIPTPYK